MTDSSTTATSSSPEIDRRTASVNSLGQDMEGKLIIDMKDPNRPRFTLQELRQVLFERNELKTRLIEVEEELNHYRPRYVQMLQKSMQFYMTFTRYEVTWPPACWCILHFVTILIIIQTLFFLKYNLLIIKLEAFY